MKTENRNHFSALKAIFNPLLVCLLITAPVLLMADQNGADEARDLADKVRKNLESNDEAVRDLVKRAMENGGRLELDAAEFEKLLNRPEKEDSDPAELGERLAELLERMGRENGNRGGIGKEELEKFLGRDWMERLGRGARRSDENGEADPAEAMKGFMEMFQRQMNGRRVGKNEREHGSVLEEYQPVVRAARKSTVAMIGGGKQLALGTVVHADGYVVTKASEVNEKELLCLLPDGERVSAEIVDTYQPLDLALVRVESSGLKPAEWVKQDQIELGSFLAAPGIGKDPIAIGVASVAPRNLSEKSKGFLGVTPEGSNGEVRIAEVIAGMPAAKAGLKAGDVVLAVDGRDVGSRAEFHRMIGGRSPGEEVDFKVRRGDEELVLTAKLVSREVLVELRGGVPRNPRIDRMNLMGGELSDNRAGYSSALQTDLTLEPSECGGPVVNLDGKVVGVNIARGGRVKSYAVPAKDLRGLLGDVDSGRFTISDLTALKERAAAAAEALEKAEAALEKARKAKESADQALEKASEK